MWKALTKALVVFGFLGYATLQAEEHARCYDAARDTVLSPFGFFTCGPESTWFRISWNRDSLFFYLLAQDDSLQSKDGVLFSIAPTGKRYPLHQSSDCEFHFDVWGAWSPKTTPPIRVRTGRFHGGASGYFIDVAFSWSLLGGFPLGVDSIPFDILRTDADGNASGTTVGSFSGRAWPERTGSKEWATLHLIQDISTRTWVGIIALAVALLLAFISFVMKRRKSLSARK